MKAKTIVLLFMIFVVITISATKEVLIKTNDNLPEKIWVLIGIDPNNIENWEYLSFEDEYIPGVVFCEVGGYSTWDDEAYKAQAVAARSYAYVILHRSDSNTVRYPKTNEIGIKATTANQAYKPPVSEKYPKKCLDAVSDTEDECIFLNGTVIESTFFSHCGDNNPRHLTNSSLMKWHYHNYLARTISPESDKANDGGHNIGMSQWGAQIYAKDHNY